MDIGDKVQILGCTGFCTPYQTIIRAIETRYDKKTGIPYQIACTSDEAKYRLDTGECILGASMYYLNIK